MTNKLKIFIIIIIGDFVMRLCIFGAASEKIDRRFITESYELAKFLAGRGHDLIFGAGGEGIMGATARGFKEVGAYRRYSEIFRRKRLRRCILSIG